MSAVVIALDTPLYAIAGKHSVLIHDIPPGDYKLHVWIEGVPQSFLDGLSRPMHFSNHGRFGELDPGTGCFRRDLPLPDERIGASFLMSIWEITTS